MSLPEIEFNVNERVKVRLTETGRKILLAQGRTYLLGKADADWWTEMSMHELMNAYGEFFYMGNSNLPCETTIRLVPGLTYIIKPVPE